MIHLEYEEEGGQVVAIYDMPKLMSTIYTRDDSDAIVASTEVVNNAIYDNQTRPGIRMVALDITELPDSNGIVSHIMQHAPATLAYVDGHIIVSAPIPLLDWPEPVADEPVADEPVADEPVADEPVADEPVADEPVADEPE